MKVLVGRAGEEAHTGGRIHRKARHAEWDQAVQRGNRNAPGKPQQAQVEEPDCPEQQRQADEVDRFAQRPRPADVVHHPRNVRAVEPRVERAERLVIEDWKQVHGYRGSNAIR